MVCLTLVFSLPLHLNNLCFQQNITTKLWVRIIIQLYRYQFLGYSTHYETLAKNLKVSTHSCHCIQSQIMTVGSSTNILMYLKVDYSLE
jgi:hypothetical protein